MTETRQSPFLDSFKGHFTSMLRWPQLDELWLTLRQQKHKNWYIYALGEMPPSHASNQQQLDTFISEVDKLLRQEHQEEYCGIVYADNREDPEFIKIYDPNNLGVSCGFSDNPPLPGWILSIHSPIDLNALPQAGNRQRWWQKLFK